MSWAGPFLPLKLSLYVWAFVPPSNTWFPAPIPVHIPNGISIGSAVFAQFMVDSPHILQWAATFLPQNCPFAMGI